MSTPRIHSCFDDDDDNSDDGYDDSKSLSDMPQAPKLPGDARKGKAAGKDKRSSALSPDEVLESLHEDEATKQDQERIMNSQTEPQAWRAFSYAAKTGKLGALTCAEYKCKSKRQSLFKTFLKVFSRLSKTHR